ncbi:CapA family protein [Rhodoferax sp.]|uniref:CapA family protein n=1 Tax=Rhodoferax sp. TaxID=50421 RepID=UPI0025E8CFBB|nr:CapA family protein [Rhodoferax sp.]
MNKPALLAVLACLPLWCHAAAPTVQLIFGGDVMLDDGPGRLIAAGGDPLAPIAPLLQAADVAIANLETSIASTTTGTPLDNKIYTFRAAPNTVNVLKGRFAAMSVANNHSGDFGRDAFMETLAHLRSVDIAAFGGGANLRAAHMPYWIAKNGIRIALLGYDEFKPRSFEAGADWPGVAWSEDSEVVADIRAAKAAGADVVIPFMHWGWEREPEPSQRQRDLAKLMVQAGADAVVGSHPHVTQGTDMVLGKPVIWSLGNLVFDGFELPAAKLGWLLRMAVDKHGVQSWNTVAVRMDADGTPTPDPGTRTPCGSRGKAKQDACLNVK